MEIKKFKIISEKVQDLDEKQGIVKIYINAFGNEDSDGDISHSKSFNRTINNNLHRIKHFLNHNSWDASALIGIPKEIYTDAKGVIAISILNMAKQSARDTFEDYKLYALHNRTLEHSIGYEVISRDEKDVRIITEYKLWEYSTLTSWGANVNTPLIDLKTKQDVEIRIKQLEMQINNFKYSYDRLTAVEKQLEALTGKPQTPNGDPSDLDFGDLYQDLITAARLQ